MIERTHALRDQLAIAVANVEAFIDGKLEPTPRRLQATLQALARIERLIDVAEISALPVPRSIATAVRGVGSEASH